MTGMKRLALLLAGFGVWFWLIQPPERAYAGTEPALSGVIDLFDTPVMVASSGNFLPGSAETLKQVVASTAAPTKAIYFANTIAAFIGVYTGASGSEVLRFVIPPSVASDLIYQQIPAGTRLSIRSMATASVTSGSFMMDLLN
jgi:hypothetical protein